MDFTNYPMAAKGLTSYRCKGGFGWIMIGAHDHADAIRQAHRSSDTVDESTLEVWDGKAYVAVTPAPAGLESGPVRGRRSGGDDGFGMG